MSTSPNTARENLALRGAFAACVTWGTALPTALAQTQPVTDAASANSAAALSIWDLIVRGGPMMIPIGLCSLVMLAIATERTIALRKRNVIPPGFFTGLDKILRSDNASAIQALRYCKKRSSPVANVIAAGVRRLSEPIERVERAIEEEGEREALGLRRRLRGLAVIASISPLIGLLGTVLGMISAFQTIAASPDAMGQTSMFAGGIYEALITTAAGLLVAIPAFILHHWLASKIERLIVEIDRIAARFLETYAAALAIEVTPVFADKDTSQASHEQSRATQVA